MFKKIRENHLKRKDRRPSASVTKTDSNFSSAVSNFIESATDFWSDSSSNYSNSSHSHSSHDHSSSHSSYDSGGHDSGGGGWD